LARDLIRLSGLSPDDIEIAFSGIRPGEKLFEELYFQEEQTLPTPHPKLRVAYHRPYLAEEISRLFGELNELSGSDDHALIFRRLRQLVPEYSTMRETHEATDSDTTNPNSSGSGPAAALSAALSGHV
jgi:FlaA1/EpsC-like NDP-sugar epimerase